MFEIICNIMKIKNWILFYKSNVQYEQNSEKVYIIMSRRNSLLSYTTEFVRPCSFIFNDLLTVPVQYRTVRYGQMNLFQEVFDFKSCSMVRYWYSTLPYQSFFIVVPILDYLESLYHHRTRYRLPVLYHTSYRYRTRVPLLFEKKFTNFGTHSHVLITLQDIYEHVVSTFLPIHRI